MNGARSTRTGTADATISPNLRPPLLVDRLEAARLLSVSPGTIDNMRKRGELSSIKLGARRLYDLADLRALIEARKEVNK